MESSPIHVSAEEATRILGITPSTLYAYVSRGFIRSIADRNNKKKRRYMLEDLEKLLLRKKTEQSTHTISQNTLQWGSPILESKISLIDNGKLYYRGFNVLELVTKNTFEEVVSLIWTGSLDTLHEQFSISANQKNFISQITYSLQDIQLFLLKLEAEDMHAYNLEQKSIEKIGITILQSLVSALTNDFSSITIAKKISNYYCKGIKNAEELISTALILIADHELNASSFTGRIVASTGATLYQVIIAGLSALSGFRHGGSIFKLDLMVNELQIDLQYEKNVKKRLKRGDSIIGFGHNLYPEGDIRAKILLDKINKYYNNSLNFSYLMKINDVCCEVTGQKANIDFALLVLSKILDQKVEFGQLLFALGRIAGWIGHAIEEYEEKRLLRPRAKYTGVQPH